MGVNMTYQILIVFDLILIAMLLFATEVISYDTVAILITGVLLVTGILSPAEGLSGFGHPATITIGAMFVISEGVRKTGVLEEIGKNLSGLMNYGFSTSLFILMLVLAFISAIINNTAAVVIFIPIIMRIAGDMGVSPSKILMPISFASMFGGVCTLIGTSTNILVSSIAEERGLRPIGMFEMTQLGLIIFFAGVVYLLTVGIRIIPERRKVEELSKSFEVNRFLAEIVVEKDFEYIGKTIKEMLSDEDTDIEVVNLFRKGKIPEPVREVTDIQEGDILRLRGNADQIARFAEKKKIRVKTDKKWRDVDLQEGNFVLVEAVIAPDSSLTTRKIKDINFFSRFGAIVIGIRSHKKINHVNLGEVRLSGGISLLLSMRHDQLDNLKKEPSFIVINHLLLRRYNKKKMPVALLILGGVVLTAAAGLVPIVVSALVGVVLMILTGCIRSDDIPRAINWKIIFLLAGIIPLGVAMDKTGAARMISNYILYFVGHLGPGAVLSAFFMVTVLLTAMISNQATAALLTPVAIQAAEIMGISARPMIFAIAFAASLSFMTPMGYQTNLLVYGPGNYKFQDYLKAGTPLTIIFWLLCSFLIPVFWPFYS
jgi:di/tricarboxylate transporter